MMKKRNVSRSRHKNCAAKIVIGMTKQTLLCETVKWQWKLQAGWWNASLLKEKAWRAKGTNSQTLHLHCISKKTLKLSPHRPLYLNSGVFLSQKEIKLNKQYRKHSIETKGRKKGNWQDGKREQKEVTFIKEVQQKNVQPSKTAPKKKNTRVGDYLFHLHQSVKH